MGLFKKVKTAPNTFLTPISGTIKPLNAVPDPVFSTEVMGKGFCIEPDEGVVYAPFDGVVTIMFPTGHAVGLVNNDGKEVLIHIGIDTVMLDGRGFTQHKKQGAKVKAGDKLITFDLELVKEKSKSHLTPVIFTNGAKHKFSEGYASAKSDGIVNFE